MSRMKCLSFAGFVTFGAAFWIGTAPPVAADDRRSLNDRFPDRTPGYVEEMLSRGDAVGLSDDAEIETSDVSTRSRARPKVSGHRFKGMKPTTPEAKARAEAFLEKNPIERVTIELNLTPGTVGFLIRF